MAAVREPQKGDQLLTVDVRRAMIAESTAHLDNVRITSFSSLVVDLAQEVGADFIIKGLRVVSDFESELMQAQMNLRVSGVHTLFIPTGSSHSFVASKFIREIAKFGGDVGSMVPPPVLKRLNEKFKD